MKPLIPSERGRSAKEVTPSGETGGYVAQHVGPGRRLHSLRAWAVLAAVLWAVMIVLWGWAVWVPRARLMQKIDVRSLESDLMVAEDRSWFIRKLPKDSRKFFISPAFVDLHDMTLSRSDFRALASWGDLRVVELTNVDFEAADLVALLEKAQLTALRIRSPKVSDDIARAVGRLTQLRSLSLEGGHVTNVAATYLAELANLENLSLEDTAIGDDALAQLEGMKKLLILRLSRTQVTDAGIQHLKSIQSLGLVEVYGTSVTAEGAADLQSAINGLRVYR
jgi:hypothetical protein